uniref:Bulb-type lectin domain-containing protein n=1 Tax=Colletotrichum fructicola (strain Nara gc5) TaxID=1213859 RepID=L2FR27_COLFN
MGPTNTDAMIVNQSGWAHLRSAGASRRSRIIIAALIMFLVSAALVLQPDWHVATSGLRVPGLHRPAASGSSTTPIPDGGGGGGPSSETTSDTDSGVLASILTPDEDGVLLSAGSPVFTSPNGRYSLVLQPDGDLVLSHNDLDGSAHALWWTDTGDKHSGGRTVIVEKKGGHVRMVVNAMLKNTWVTVWHSDLLTMCKNQAAPEGGALVKKGGARGSLELSNDGKLTLAGACDLRIPPDHREKSRSLAVIVAGLYRTNHVTCKTHMEHLVDGHPSFTKIDVFAYMLYEPADVDVHGRTKESIEAELRACYGTHLRSVDVVPVAEAEVEYPGGEAAMLLPCGDRLRRLNNQLRTVSLAAQRWWAWTVANGFTHDTVMRIRPDTSFWARPGFKSLEELGDALVLPHPKGEHYFYCARMKGSVGVGPTDQIAYGNAASMQQWLDCPRPAPCSIECLVAWYLDARGVDFRIEWGWEQNPLRWKDIGMLGAEEERMADQHQEDKDDGMTWG